MIIKKEVYTPNFTGIIIILYYSGPGRRPPELENADFGFSSFFRLQNDEYAKYFRSFSLARDDSQAASKAMLSKQNLLKKR